MVVKPEIETFQNEWELLQMLIVVANHHPKKILEVGAWHGGTLWHWLQLADEVAVIDDEMRRESDWQQWAKERRTGLHLYHGSSHDKEIIEKAASHAPYDFLFIDADHTYDSVCQDWNNYYPMVREGGLVAFHDIYERYGYGVSEVWEDLISTPGMRYMEIRHGEVQPGNEGLCGIGLIWV